MFHVQGDQVMDQQAPLFSLRVTELRDGSCVLAASFLHILADGEHTSCCTIDMHSKCDSLHAPLRLRCGPPTFMLHRIHVVHTHALCNY